MAELHALRGFRYHPDRVPDLAQVVTPPYDVITPEAQERYYQRSPLNSIRLELGKDEPGDDVLENRYTRAAMTFAQWRVDGTLRQEPTPALYLYQQQFEVNGRSYQRTSLVGRVQLQPWEAGIILPHEQTMARPKSDRLRLLRACAANLSPIMATFEDDGTLRSMLATCTERAPDVAFADDANEHHRLWIVPDPGQIAQWHQALASKQLFIADGHHRYETALAYREEVRELHRGLAENDAANFVLMALIPMTDPGLVVLPTHRLVRNLDPSVVATLPERLAPYWDLDPLDSRLSVKTLAERLSQAGATGTAVVIATSKQRWLARLKTDGQVAARMQATGEPDPWQRLDVARAQELILGAALDISREAIATGDHLNYTRDAAQALTEVRNQKAQVAILLNATRPEQVRDVAMVGGRMPQKSTYFYPKLITGLVINPLW